MYVLYLCYVKLTCTCTYRILKVFFKKDASCATLPGYNKETPLHNAVYGGHIETIRFILEHEPNVNAR